MTNSMILAKCGVQSAIWELQLIPRRIEFAYLAHKQMKNSPEAKEERAKKAEEKKEAKTEKMKAKQAEKEAKRAFKESQSEEFSEEMTKNIYKMADTDVSKRTGIFQKALDGQKLVQYAYWYMTDEKATLVKKNQTDREIINSIASYFGFGKIYESAGVIDLRIYDPSYENEYFELSKYIFCINDFVKKSEDKSFMEKIAARKEQILAESQSPQDDEPEEDSSNPSHFWTVNEEGLYNPIYVVKDAKELNPELPIQGAGISDKAFKKLEELFKEYLTNDEKHRYEALDNGMYKFYITRKETGVEEFYTVDLDGMVMGCNKSYILANTENDTMFVSFEHKDIIKNILQSGFYRMSHNEYQKVIQDYFRNLNIYRYIDLTNSGFLKELSPEDFQKLGKKITFILSKLAGQNASGDFPRFRFNKWVSVEDFMIISDPEVKSPLADVDGTSKNICEGLIYEVSGDDIHQYYKGTQVDFHIEKYGDM